MPKDTDRLNLPLPLGNENVTRESINAIFEKIDAGVATQADLDALREAVSKMDIPDASLTQKGKVQLSNAVDSNAENMAATPKAVKNAVSEVVTAIQLGVEQKAKMVSALNNIGVVASTIETWEQLVDKVAGVIKATGNASSKEVLSGYTFSNTEANKLTGTMMNQGAKVSTINTQGGEFFIPAGYHNGGGKITAYFENLVAGNVKNAVNIGGVIGNLQTIELTSELSDYVLKGMPSNSSYRLDNPNGNNPVGYINTFSKSFSLKYGGSVRVSVNGYRLAQYETYYNVRIKIFKSGIVVYDKLAKDSYNDIVVEVDSGGETLKIDVIYTKINNISGVDTEVRAIDVSWGIKNFDKGVVF
ncbi:tail fiber protein [Paenibacillus silvae]|uniref:Tail fiber protein n=1 Tax=Paenibacillus silvae TaxID=1325358 RepID=A0A2W6NAW5_9BACL|nr:tail fiber protein [Paenibacillus silvae]PZT52749.1 hypothetical protein DN757_25920 [Paenibacillus silvae]